MLMSNIVVEENLKKVQKETLESIASVISKTAGPYGSSTMILHDGAVTEYSKDGHKVLSNIAYLQPIERAVHDELLNITKYVVKNVGDGTTSAVQLSNIIFGKLCELLATSSGLQPHMVVEALHTATDAISTIIKDQKTADLTLDDIYDICMIATNGNVDISNDIRSIYEKLGNDVYIEISTSNSANTVTKTYDGIYLDKGMPNAAYINTKDGTCELNHPRIYYFEDNVDDPMMINLFMSIIMKNMYDGYYNKSANYVSTLIIAPTVSQDLKESLAQIEQIMYSFDKENVTIGKPPICIVTGINSNDNIDDIVMLCDCPRIKKFINPEVEQKAIEEGNAPTVDNVVDFYGEADMVVVDADTTKFINPKNMYNEDPDEDGNPVYSAVFTGLVQHIKAELARVEELNEDLTEVVKLKKQLNHLEANFVEYFIGGVAPSDRDNVRDLAEDAVLNCRSAVVNGIGRGCNFEGAIASAKYILSLDKDLDKATSKDMLQYKIATIIKDSYVELISALYRTAYIGDEAVEKFNESVEKEQPINLRTDSYEDRVICSLNTDPIILEAVTKIMSVMVLSNQALVQEPLRNAYLKMDEESTGDILSN